MHPQARKINGLPVGFLGFKIFRICTIAFFQGFIQMFDVPVNIHTFMYVGVSKQHQLYLYSQSVKYCILHHICSSYGPKRPTWC